MTSIYNNDNDKLYLYCTYKKQNLQSALTKNSRITIQLLSQNTRKPCPGYSYNNKHRKENIKIQKVNMSHCKYKE